MAEGLRYDAWANELWIQTLPLFRDKIRAENILRHTVQAQWIWLNRVLGEEETNPVPENLLEAVVSLNTAWQECLIPADPGAYVVYNKFDGEQCFSSVLEICLHVINHGTYHRGHLRGLAEAEGLTDFPETDLIKFFRAFPSERV